MPPPKSKNAVRLGKIELQLGYLTDSIKTLSIQIEKTENTRNESLLNYVQEHSKVVNNCAENTKDLNSLRTEFDASLNNTVENFSTFEKRIDDWDKKISPLLTAHKVLVWVAIFFASSIGLLLWGIFTHTVSVIFTK
jgi:septation ring formation regulator EzrA